MKQQISLPKIIMPIVGIFIFINCITLLFQQKLMQYNIDGNVVMCANSLLFFTTTLCLALHTKAFKNANPNAMVRSIMLASLIKLVVFATAVLIYVSIAQKNSNVNGVIAAMILYFIYTFIEVKIALKLNNSNGSK